MGPPLIATAPFQPKLNYTFFEILPVLCCSSRQPLGQDDHSWKCNGFHDALAIRNYFSPKIEESD